VGFPIRSEEGAVLGVVLIHAHGHMQGFLDIRHRTPDLDKHAIAGAGNYLEPILPCEVFDGLIIRTAGTILFSELVHGENFAVVRAGRVLLFPQEFLFNSAWLRCCRII
jgi:hypothetical protein